MTVIRWPRLIRWFNPARRATILAHERRLIHRTLRASRVFLMHDRLSLLRGYPHFLWVSQGGYALFPLSPTEIAGLVKDKPKALTPLATGPLEEPGHILGLHTGLCSLQKPVGDVTLLDWESKPVCAPYGGHSTILNFDLNRLHKTALLKL